MKFVVALKYGWRRSHVRTESESSLKLQTVYVQDTEYVVPSRCCNLIIDLPAMAGKQAAPKPKASSGQGQVLMIPGSVCQLIVEPSRGKKTERGIRR